VEKIEKEGKIKGQILTKLDKHLIKLKKLNTAGLEPYE